VANAFRFDGENVAAQRAAARHAAQFVTEISAETRRAIRDIVLRSIREGVPAYDAARMIAGFVGMTEKQTAAAANYRAQLIDSGLRIDRVDRQVERYVGQKIRERAETIARTEIMAALNEGALESWEQAQKEGLLGEGATKEWITTPDERLCPLCAPLDGQTVSLKGKFGTVDGPPLHPRCRCAIAVNP
jgi:SPP1 gp7 family putative phage head morphogenesis protein